MVAVRVVFDVRILAGHTVVAFEHLDGSRFIDEVVDAELQI